MMDNPGVTAPATIDIDLAGVGNVQPTLLSGSFAVPDDPNLAQNGVGVASVFTTDYVIVGGTTQSDINPAGTAFDFTAQWVEPINETFRTRYTTSIVDGPFTAVYINGLPMAGPVDPQFLTPPSVVNVGDPQPIHDSLTWTVAPGEPVDFMLMSVFDENRYLGIVVLAADKTELTLPALPSTSDEAAHLSGNGLQGFVWVCNYSASSGCNRIARDRVMNLTP
jgi:hypothetical protein